MYYGFRINQITAERAKNTYIYNFGREFLERANSFSEFRSMVLQIAIELDPLLLHHCPTNQLSVAIPKQITLLRQSHLSQAQLPFQSTPSSIFDTDLHLKVTTYPICFTVPSIHISTVLPHLQLNFPFPSETQHPRKESVFKLRSILH